jgi:integrase
LKGGIFMPTQRRSEAIWIEAKGYWQIKVQKDGVRKGFTSSVKGRKGKHEAEAKADYWLERGTADMRFCDAWETFLAWQQQHNGTGNYKKHECAGRLYLLPENGSRKLSAIRPTHWQRCIDIAAEKGLSRRSCENIRASITAFLRHAKRERWEFVPLEDGDVIIPNSTTPEKQKRVLSAEDIRTIFSDPTIERYGKKKHVHWIYAWRFFIVTGLRRGELAGLRKEDITGQIINVRRSINSTKEITHGKNDNARRSFAITPTMRSILDDQADYLKSEGIVSDWVFPDQYGEMPNPNALHHCWTHYAKQHGIKSNIHELRHTFISMNKSDMPIELLKMVAGHSKSMDTIGIYGHAVDGDQERAAEIMDSTFLSLIKNKVGGKVGG